MAKYPLFNALKRYFFAGIAAILPLYVSIYLIVLVLRFFDQFAGKFFNSFLLKEFGFTVPGLGLIVAISVAIIIGILYTHFIGRKLTIFLEKIILRTPLVSGIYPSVKQLSDFLFQRDKKGDFKKVVLVEYPQKDSYSIGFITNENLAEFSQKTGAELISVFVPFPPSPFSGAMVLVPKAKIVKLDISIDEALKFIVSGGIIQPHPGKPASAT